MNKEDFKALKELLKIPSKIAIVSHRNPDGDAYGSSLAIFHLLKKKGHEVTVVSPNDCPDFLKWLPGQDEIIVFETDSNKGTEILHQSDMIFTLDFNALHRVGSMMEKELIKFKGTYIMIDHHEQPDDYANFMYSNPTISSTCQLIYHFLEEMGELAQLDKDIATCLYTGLVTDTGSFKYAATNSDTHAIAAYLMDYNIEHSKIHNRLYDSNSLARLQLLGAALNNLKMVSESNTAYISLSQKDLNTYNYKKGDTEGFVNYALSLKNIVFAVIFIEDQKQGIIKMSLRSKGTFSVNEFARKHFNGGGHSNAAGGKSDLPMKQTIDEFLRILPNYTTNLNKANEN